MSTAQYFDHDLKAPIDPATDGCAFAEWAQRFGEAKFARTTDGFLVFLPPSELDASDEYKESDPYTVELNVSTDFHQRRFECTMELVRDAVKKIKGPLRILDLGCGEGHITVKFKQEYPDTEVAGLDYSISAIRYAHNHFPGIDFIVGNAYAPPYPEGYFDIVVCNNLWEHVSDPLLLLDKISLILKPNGFVIISTPSRYRWSNLIRAVRGKPIQFMSDKHVTEYSVGQVIEQLRYGGYDTARAYSRPNNTGKPMSEFVKGIVRRYLASKGSHHQLESTVFYLAERRSGGG